MLNSSPTELTTAATDAALAIECVFIVLWLLRSEAPERWKVALWCWLFGLTALSALLGAIAHGFELTEEVREAIWVPLYLSLGIVVGLIIVAAVYDWRGRNVAARLVIWTLMLGAGFFAVTQFVSGAFVVFLVYEAVALLCAFTIYFFLAAKRRLPGVGVIALAIALSMIAAAVQASDARVVWIVPFDHNGIFHVVQIIAVAMLAAGLRQGLRPAG
jgi:hypothetical protein